MGCRQGAQRILALLLLAGTGAVYGDVLEIQEAEFDPVGKGKNAVDIRARNLGDEARLLAGQRIATLSSGLRAAGEHSVVWHALDEHSEAMASGQYLYRLRAPEWGVAARAMLVLR